MFENSWVDQSLFNVSAREWDNWQWQYAHRFRQSNDLKRIPWLNTKEINRIGRIIKIYPYAVTPYFLSLINGEDPNDPIRKQILPDKNELCALDGNCLDPLAEKEHTVAPGLIHRYPDRAVLLATNRCAVYCRHCFRKRLWPQHSTPRSNFSSHKQAFKYLQRHTEIRDLLLSGGDPLTLRDTQLEEILSHLRKIPHLEIIRIGSRIPVVMPQRITTDLCGMLEKYSPLWLNTQFNHSQEIRPEAAAACDRLLRAGIPVNNQTVLLRGVNDNTDTIKALCQALLRIRVKPYYLHQCDQVAGAEHFRAPLKKGIKIIKEMQGVTSGLAIPKFMVDLPGRGGKLPLQANYLVSATGQRFVLKNYAGEHFIYEDPAD